jgi:hypothetical protein
VTLERRLYPPPLVASPEQHCLPDCGVIHKELKSRKNVTLQLLWEQYKQANPLGYANSSLNARHLSNHRVIILFKLLFDLH